MSARRFYALAAAAFVGLIVAGALLWRAAIPVIPHQNMSMEPVVPSGIDSLDAVLTEAEDVTVSNDPFRLANAPAAVRYNPNETGIIGSSPAAAPALARPTLTLKAIVGGPPWQAIVDGIPGQPQGTLVRSGSAFDKLVARSVTRDSVVMQGPDTTWVLSFRRRQ